MLLTILVLPVSEQLTLWLVVNNTVPDGGCWEREKPLKFFLELFRCQVNQLLKHLCCKWEGYEEGLGTVSGPWCATTFQWLFFFSSYFFLNVFKEVMLRREKFLLCTSVMPKQLIYWYFLCNSMVKHLLKVSVWLPHLEVTFKKMWTAKSLCSAQILLLQLKKGRLCPSMFPKAQRFWIGILNYCTVGVPRNRVKFQVSIFVLL